MKITDMRVAPVSLPMRRAHNTGVRASERQYAILRIDTDQRISGYGEATVLKEWGGAHGRYFGESYGTVRHVITDYLAPALRGEDPFDIERLHERMDRIIKGHPYAKAAIDIALYDIMGKALKVPIHDLLGGLYRREVLLCHSISLLPPDEAVAEAQLAVAEGLRAIKIKVGPDPNRDVETVQRVREAVGPEVALVIDANMLYGTAKEAIRIIRQMEPCRLTYAEQPVESLEAMAAVAQALDTPIMHDEGAWTAQDVIEIAAKKAGDAISLYTTKPGGLHPAKKVAAVCEAVGLPCNVNGSGETGIGNAANLHLAGSTKVVTLPSVIMVTATAERAPNRLPFYLDDVIREPFEYRDGCLVVPEGPGLGVDVDEDKLERYSHRLA